MPSHLPTLMAVGDWVSPAIAIVVASLVTGFFSLTSRKISENQREANEQRANSSAHQVKIEEIVGDMHRALVTAEPTELQPDPPIGIVDSISEMRKRQIVIDREVRTMKVQIEQVTKQVTQNGGKENTVIDRLSRIEDLVATSLCPQPTDRPADAAKVSAVSAKTVRKPRTQKPTQPLS